MKMRVRLWTWAVASLASSVFGSACDGAGQARLERALVGRGRVAVIGGEDLVPIQSRGAALLPVRSIGELDRAIAGTDEAEVARAMAAAEVHGLLVDARPGRVPHSRSVASRLARYERMQALQGAYLSSRASLYVLDPVRQWSPRLRGGIAHVARRLIGGAPPPHLRSFPESVRRMEPAEVMVLLRSGKRARLWRSARGSSFARALLTAADVARQRWTEREQAMGGALDELLPSLQVEVSLLQDDGELGEREPGFVNRVVLPVHGVAYEHKGSWRYMLPETTHASGRTPAQSYAKLFTEDGLPADSLPSVDIRPYRMAVQVIGISAPQPTAAKPGDDALSEVRDPDEVLAP